MATVALTFANIQKDKKLHELVTKFAKSEYTYENLAFLEDKSSNDKIYATYIDPKSAKLEVNLPAPILKVLNDCAKEKKWKDKAMIKGLADARANILALFENNTLMRFQVSPVYLAHITPPNPETPKTKKLVEQMEKDMVDGTKFFTTATAAIKSKGLPANKDEVKRIFSSGRMRHDKVHEAFTERLQKDKGFTRQAYGTVFTKKDSFSKLWADYRKVLGA